MLHTNATLNTHKILYEFLVTVTWYKDGVPIEEESSKYQFVQAGKKFQMKILSSTTNDMGQYMVKATAKKEETEAAFSLNVCAAGEI